jgi:hypothetical protein
MKSKGDYMQKPSIFVPIFITVISALVLMFTFFELENVKAQLKEAPKNTVYSVCQISRQTNKISESTCGELQDYYLVEYLCEQKNNSANNQCWVESK